MTKGLSFVLALALAFLLVGGASILFERVLYARLYGASELDQVLLSIGLVFMAVAAFTFFYGPSPQRVAVPDYLTGQIDPEGKEMLTLAIQRLRTFYAENDVREFRVMLSDLKSFPASDC